MYCDGRSTGILNKPFGKRSYPSWRQWGSSIYIGWNSGSICGISVGSLGLPTMGEFESYSCRRHWKKIAWKMQRNAALVFPALGWEATKRMFMDGVVLLCEPRTCWSLGTSTMSLGNAINKYLFFFFFFPQCVANSPLASVPEMAKLGIGLFWTLCMGNNG